MWENVGMAVPKPQKLGVGMAVYRQDRFHTSNLIPAYLGKYSDSVSASSTW